MSTPIEQKRTNPVPGYRLEYFEVYNWGTFDRTISRLVPDCASSMLTGANGSGKTTLVDALLTLLVPNSKRHYNQSSGNERKKERDENSYVLGYWEKSQDAELQKGKPLMLRTHKDYSILLGCFYNAHTDAYVTLAQVRWYSGTTLEKRFIVSPNQLSIATHFSELDPRGDWRRKMKAQIPNTEIGDSFTEYSTAFRKYFGMRSDKALNLFNLLVGTKSIDDLNNFIRQNMLEEPTAEDDFIDLKNNFQSLIDTYKSIRKSEKQIEMLDQVEQLGNKYTELEKEYKQLESLIEALSYYYPEQEKRLLQNQVEELEEQGIRDKAAVDQMQADIKELRNAEMNLLVSRNANETSKAIESIDQQTEKLNDTISRKESNKSAYDSLLVKTTYTPPVNEKDFLGLRSQIDEDLLSISSEIEEVEEEHSNEYVKQNRAKEQSIELEKEISSLRNRRTQIPERMLEIRTQLLNAIGVADAELPFIGELIRIKPDEKKKWEMAIERLLHGFGLSLLVPEKHLRAVNAYVNETRLRGRLVYHKVDARWVKQNLPEIPENSLRDKIEIKNNVPEFETWLEHRLSEQFDYICTDDHERFLQERKALMPKGLHKSIGRHEKDDREHRMGPENYILGWDNKEKLEVLIRQNEQIKRNIESSAGILKSLLSKRDGLWKREEVRKDILKFKVWIDLDASGERKRVKELKQQRDKLSESSDVLRKLDEEISKIGREIESLDNRKTTLDKKIGADEAAIKKHSKRIEEINTLLAHVPDTISLTDFFDQLQSYIQPADDADPVKQLLKEKELTSKHLDNKKKTVGDLLANARRAVENAMKDFVQPPKRITDEFPDWVGDVLNMDHNAEYMEPFLKMLQQLKDQGLPDHKNRFRNYMSESVLNRITSFRSSLEERKKDIETDIQQLNDSLQKIDFESYPPTFIQFEYRQNYDDAIKRFREELLACIPAVSEEVTGDQYLVLEQSFLKIQALIERLYGDPLIRKKVIDVRNWFLFKAQEYYRNDERAPGRYYEGSQSLSGGQSVQLTYTVIGAAVAYQFGINDENSAKRSFRFVAVDEAFSNLDQDKSDYLMKFAKQLQLQLLVVTPLDKLHIAEPYIESCHYVVNKERKNSRVYHMPMEEYRSRKEEMQASEE